MKILLVDDTLTERLVLNRYLTAMNHEVVMVETGEQAVTAFVEAQPDLVLLDVMLPGIDGYQVVQKIREVERHWTPVIFLSGKNTAEDIKTGIDAGGDDYLTKPVNRLVLTAKLQAMQRIADMRQTLIQTQQHLEEANQKLSEQAIRDGLTGIANRRHLEQILDTSFKRAQRTQSPLTVMMCDIDWFKPFNDQLGHLKGDECLIQVAQLMSEVVQRPYDLLARYGGEEFCVVLGETDLGGGMHIADMLLNKIRNAAIPHPTSPNGIVSISIGVACSHNQPAESYEALLKQADKSLYQAKEQGRDRAVCFDA
ncbi:diguanylate cyclase [Aliagarivorans taiwanensis]|uniref:diguanylate cyclase n=1 Tax=Aliagarivorans taiwanensis TaxID=561966 RepID=UPI000427F538|nr:diguanylate cyclase [Aliagarivorans taiwanensis]